MIIKNKKDCSGCHACASVCPKNCISMSVDSEGFLYPVIDENLCVDCGLCEKVCQHKNPIDSDTKPVLYGAYNKNEDIRLKSSSGGMFTLLAEKIIDMGGVVFGAAFDDAFNVCHIAIDNKVDLDKLRGSKYLQSVIGDAYIKAKEFLDSGKPVLFTGTPCQCDGLLHYIGKRYDNLYVQDFICHGVPSQLLWQKYLKFRETIAASKTRRTFFRHKKYGWKMYSVQLIFNNCTEYIQIFKKDLYMSAFLADVALRPSCYNCASKSVSRNSDITLADFWGVDLVLPEMNDDKGMSLILVNSEKGRCLLDSVSENAVIKEVEAGIPLKCNPAVSKSAKRPGNRKKFYNDIETMNFEKAVLRNTKVTLSRKLIFKSKQIIKGVIKQCKKQF